jgi:hypothetical protein
MHEKVLSDKQKELLPLISSFSADFGLIGGTAVALQIGHRTSIDFDLVTFFQLDARKIRAKIGDKFSIAAVLIDETNEYTLVINGVKVTFMTYPFKFNLDVSYEDIIRMPDLLTLASIKAYALGRRAKWKDYVDLYFIFERHSFDEVIKRAEAIFGNEFNEKLFREELSYFDDIDHTEEVNYAKGFEVEDELVKQKLSEISLQKV